MAKRKRLKHVKRTLLYYKTHFDIRPPYKVLIDGTFCKEALKFKINIWEQLPKYLDAEVKLFTTNCALKECENFGSKPDLPLYGVYKVISQYDIEACYHLKPMSPSLCLLKMARMGASYFFATQERELSERLTSIHGVPLLYIAHNSINLEPPSQASRYFSDVKQQEKLGVSSHEKSLINKITEQNSELGLLNIKRKKLRQPNPLSCKKKVKTKQQVEVNKKIKKRHRKRKHSGS